MFKLFKKKQKQQRASLEQVADGIATMVKMLVLGNDKENHRHLPDSLQFDRFFVSYISGMAGCGSRIAGSESSGDTGYAIHEVFDRLFPGRGNALLDAILSWKSSGDPILKDAALLGMKELLNAHSVLSREGGSIAKALCELRGLQQHLATRVQP